MNKNQLLHKFEEIWVKHSNKGFQHILERGFVIQFDQDEQDCELLFIGINPAYSDRDKPYSGSYSRLQSELNKLQYFKPFFEFETTLRDKYNWSGNWTHLDVFAFRETNQKFIEQGLLNNPDGIGFLFDQLMVSRERILHIKPKVIVVSNALARMFMGKERTRLDNGSENGVWMGFRFKFDIDIGTDIIIEPDSLADTKVFFSSMLSGQRALDNGSKERLIWHIAKALGLLGIEKDKK